MSCSLRNKVHRKFKMIGYTLKVEALTEILSFVDRFPDAIDVALDLLLDELHHLCLKSSILDKETGSKVVSILLEAEAAVEENPNSASIGFGGSVLRIINTFDVLKFRYDLVKKIFYDGFLVIQNSLDPLLILTISEYGTREISPIQSLVGQTGRRWIMGLISQLEDGHFYLEDLTAAVEVDLSNAILLIREKSVAFCTGVDFFGGGIFTKEETLRLLEMETRAVKDMFVIFSDIWLDNEETMGSLETVLNGYQNVDVVPSLFVFMGNFCSRPCNLAFNSFSELRLQFGKLGQMISFHQRLMEHSRFLFIPGPDDVGPSTALPRCPLPKYITEELQKHIPNAIFSSNPCRVKFCTQEIVFFHQFLLYGMRRSCLIPYSKEEASDPFKHLVATIVHQRHLCPLPLSVQPIIWNYDHCLHLYPTPHTIVLADKSEQNKFTYKGIACLNPGPFSIDSTFVVYRPCTREVELSNL